MSFNYTQPYIVVGAFIVRDGKVLLIQENHPPDKGKWNIPAGKLDFGEGPLDAAKREAFEEAGIDFSPTYLLGIHSIYRQDVPGEVHALRVIFGGEAKNDVSLAEPIALPLGQAAPHRPVQLILCQQHPLRLPVLL